VPKPRPPRLDELPDLAAPDEAFAFLRVSKTTGYDLIRRGILPAVRFGRIVRVPRKALEAFANGRQG
jgi:excisionase family DNA binding protein